MLIYIYEYSWKLKRHTLEAGLALQVVHVDIIISKKKNVFSDHIRITICQNFMEAAGWLTSLSLFSTQATENSIKDV